MLRFVDPAASGAAPLEVRHAIDRDQPISSNSQRATVMRLRVLAMLCVSFMGPFPAFTGPPYVTDDPEPTDYRHWEIYVFGSGTEARDGSGGATGLDFNYGAGPDLQLSLTLPLGYDSPSSGTARVSLGNIEMAAKFRLLHQESIGWDVSVFPRLFLPSGSPQVGERHVSFLLPLWVGRSWGAWSTFGGGGCVLNHGGESQDFCVVSWAVTRQVLPNMQLGAEIYHRSADTIGGHPSTALGIGAIYDLSEHYRLLASFGPSIHNPPGTESYAWYAAVGFNF